MHLLLFLKYHNLVRMPSASLNYELAGSLEEFGLSKYEARAYITLIEKGTLGASEIAYYSNLPRTKIYNTLKKLEKKRLSIISSQKPLIASPVPPEEAFLEIMSLHEKRLKNMKKIITSLKAVEEQGKDRNIMEERKYQLIDAKATSNKIKDLLNSSKRSIDLMVDSWGLSVFLQCREALFSAIARKVKIRVLLGFQGMDVQNINLLPIESEIRLDNFSGSMLSFDSSNVIFIDSSNGKAAMTSSYDTFSIGQFRGFEEKWRKALKIKNLNILGLKETFDAMILLRFVNGRISRLLLDQAVSPNPDPKFILDTLAKYGINLIDRKFSELIKTIDHALKLGYSGFLKYDHQHSLISLHTETDESTIVPWAIIISAYLKTIGNEPKMMCDFRNGLANVIHLKLPHQISNEYL